LACGFLLVILSCALYSNWLPLLVVATYVLAPLPNAICARYAAGEDFMSESSGYPVALTPHKHSFISDHKVDWVSGAYQDLGKFITGFLVVTGLGNPQLPCFRRLC